MNNTCLNNKVLPYEPGYCDCCFSENINVKVCPSNNKCEYAMCEKCIKNLENKTKTNKCPACREEIISIKDLKLEEPEIENPAIARHFLEMERHESNWRINCKCCVCVLDYPRPSNLSTRTLVYCSLAQQICCCIYNKFKKDYGRKTAFLFTSLIYIACILIGRIIYAEFYGEITPEEYWCVWYLFIGKALIGFAIGICLTVVVLLACACLFQCCCEEREDY